MNGHIAIDFRPGSDAVPRILRIVSGEGYDLYGLHLVPSCAERATLMIDIGRLGWVQLAALEARIGGLDGVLAIIHASPTPAAPKVAAAAARVAA
ncbi:hypothetical protein [Sphingomonas sp.]|uniref:hypothetical protein n=1 Tax=Sphingomonas sp. TaxID=28214 RepID=UPI002FCA4B96